MKSFRYSRVREAGHTLVEVLVAIALFVVVSAITGALIVNANQTTRRATSAAVAQSQLQDTVLRMSREVAVSDPIVSAKPTQLETLTVRGTATVSTRFWYHPIDTVKKTGEIRSKEAIAPAVLPLLNADITGFKVVAQNVKEEPTAPQGATVAPRILAYVDGNDNAVGDGAAALTATELKQVARVKINLNATVKDRSEPLTLVTSMATRLGLTPGGGPPRALPTLDCPSPTTPGRELTQMAWSWGTAPYGADNIRIDRLTDPPTSTVTQNIGVATTNWTDTTLAAATTYEYKFTWTGPLGPSPTCGRDVIAVPLPLAPVLGAYPDDSSKNMVKWNAPGVGEPAVHHYVVSRSDTQAGTFTDIPTGTVNWPSVTWSDTEAAVRAKLASTSTSWYKVRAFQTSDTSRPSPLSNANVAVQYPDSPLTTKFDVPQVGAGSTSSAVGNAATGTNHVAWTASVGSTSGYQVYSIQGGAAAVNSGTSATLTFDQPKLRGTRTYYWAVGVNTCHVDASDTVFPDPNAGVPCLSNNKPGGSVTSVKAEIYQSPNEPTTKVEVDPGLLPPSSTNKTSLSSVRNADANNTGDKFCTLTPTLCTFKLWRMKQYVEWLEDSGYTVKAMTTDASGEKVINIDPALSDANAGGDWGYNYYWAFKSCNPGGCSGQSSSSKSTNTYPSPFAIDAGASNGGWIRWNLQSTNQGGNDYAMRLFWDTSNGDYVSYKTNVLQTPGNPATGTVADYSTASIPWGADQTMPASVRPMGGTRYTNTVWARSSNGLERPVDYYTQTGPSVITKIEMGAQCGRDAATPTTVNNVISWNVNDVQRMRFHADTTPVGGGLVDATYWDTTRGGALATESPKRDPDVLNQIPILTNNTGAAATEANSWKSLHISYRKNSSVAIRFYNTLARPAWWENSGVDYDASETGHTMELGYGQVADTGMRWNAPSPGATCNGGFTDVAYSRSNYINFGLGYSTGGPISQLPLPAAQDPRYVNAPVGPYQAKMSQTQVIPW